MTAPILSRRVPALLVPLILLSIILTGVSPNTSVTSMNITSDIVVPAGLEAWQVVGPEESPDGPGRQLTAIWREEGRTPFFFTTKMAIDADGSPHAYNPDNTGLD